MVGLAAFISGPAGIRALLTRGDMESEANSEPKVYLTAHHVSPSCLRVLLRPGVNVLLGPVISPLGRMAEGGRNWEGAFMSPLKLSNAHYHQVSAMTPTSVGHS